MRIGIDARAIYSRNGKGLKFYSYHLISNLMRLDKKNQYYLFYNENDSKSDEMVLTQNFFAKECFQRGGERFYLWEQLKLPIESKRANIDIFHSPANTVSIFGMQKTILTLHDMLMFEEDIDNLKGKYTFYMRYLQTYFYKKAKCIITVSNYSKDRIVKMLGINPDRINVIYNGIGDEFKVIDKERVMATKEKFNISGDYIFTVGANTKRKNVSALIKAYLELVESEAVREKLVISGVDEHTRKDFERLCPGLKDSLNVKFLPYMATKDLVALYSGAKLFVFPSLGEGFGFPPLEAMACGTPVIASSYTSMPEILGDAAYLIDAKKSDEISKAIKLFLNNDALRADYRIKGFKRAKLFFWEETARKTLDVYCNFARGLGVYN